MDHTDHTNLLRDGIATPGGVWADFGAGAGAFTLALADLLGPGAEIVAIDRDASRVEPQYWLAGSNQHIWRAVSPKDTPLNIGAIQ